MYKWCPEHGSSKVLIATDADYWRRARGVYQAAGNAAALQHADGVRMSVRLRTLSRSYAAFLPDHCRNYRSLQSTVPDLLRRRPWARLMIVAVLGCKWLMGMSALWLLFGSLLNGSSPYGMLLAIVSAGVDAAALVLLFSRQASQWLRSAPA
jgi:hypothetical protein